MWKIVMIFAAMVGTALTDDRTPARAAWDGSATTVSASASASASSASAAAVATAASSPSSSSASVYTSSTSSVTINLSSTPSPASILSTLPQLTITQAAIAQVSQQRDPSLASTGYYPPSRRERPPTSVGADHEETSLKMPGSAKPTKYHYYPHNQHIYLLPECAVQQVCNAVYVRLNYTQPLCACPSRYREPCSASLDSDDHHTTELSTGSSGKVLTLVKTCEPVADMRLCRAPRDWSLLALQNIRTGKSHYLVICRCPDTSLLEGPMSHDQPTYASVPGIRVYGMMCVGKTSYEKSVTPSPILSNTNRRGRPLRASRSYKTARSNYGVPFPWEKVYEIIQKGII